MLKEEMTERKYTGATVTHTKSISLRKILLRRLILLKVGVQNEKLIGC